MVFSSLTFLYLFLPSVFRLYPAEPDLVAVLKCARPAYRFVIDKGTVCRAEVLDEDLIPYDR